MKFRAKSVLTLPLDKKAKYLVDAADGLGRRRGARARQLPPRAAAADDGRVSRCLGIAHEDGLINEENVVKPDAEKLERPPRSSPRSIRRRTSRCTSRRWSRRTPTRGAGWRTCRRRTVTASDQEIRRSAENTNLLSLDLPDLLFKSLPVKPRTVAIVADRQRPDLGGRALTGLDRAVHVALPSQARVFPREHDAARGTREPFAQARIERRIEHRVAAARPALVFPADGVCREQQASVGPARPGGRPRPAPLRTRRCLAARGTRGRRRAGSGSRTASAVPRRRPTRRRSGDRSRTRADGAAGARTAARTGAACAWRRRISASRSRAPAGPAAPGSNSTSRSVDAGSAATQKSASSSRRVPRSSMVTRTPARSRPDGSGGRRPAAAPSPRARRPSRAAADRCRR